MRKGGQTFALFHGSIVQAFLHAFLLVSTALAVGQSVPTLMAASGPRESTPPKWQREVSPSQPSLPQQSNGVISGTPGIVTRQAVVNVRDLAQREALVPPPRTRRVTTTGALTTPDNLPLPDRASSVEDDKIAAPSALRPEEVVISSPAPLHGFQALNNSATQISQDAALAVGVDRMLLMTPNQTRISDKEGNTILDFSTQTFWASLDVNTVIQPRAFYDRSIGRFVVVLLAEPQSPNASILFGISETSDPTANWRLAKVRFDPQGQVSPDWLNLGYFDGRIVATANAFNLAPPGSFNRAEIFVLSENSLYQGNASVTVFHDTTGAGSLAPALNYDTGSSAEYLFCIFNGSSNGRGYSRVSKITGPLGAEQYTPAEFLPSVPHTWALTSPGNAPFAPQKGSSEKIYLGDARAQKAIFANGRLFGSNSGFIPANDPTRSVGQLFEINVTNGEVVQFLRVEGPTGNDFVAAPTFEVSQNNDITLLYNRFSPVQYPSVNFSYRAGTDPLNTLRGDVLIKESTGPLVVSNANWVRWNPAALDPNGLGMWLYGAYVNGGPAHWATLVTPPQRRKETGDTNVIGSSFFEANAAGISIFPRLPEAVRVTLTGMQTYNPGAAPGSPFNLLTGTAPDGNRSITRSLLNRTPQTWLGPNAFGDYTIYPLDIPKNSSIVIGIEGNNFIGDSGPPNPNVVGEFSEAGLNTFRPKADYNDLTNWLYRPRLEVTSTCNGSLIKTGTSFDSSGTLPFQVAEIRLVSHCRPAVVTADSWINNITVIERPDNNYFIYYTVAPNSSPSVRNGVFTIGDQVFTVTQSGNSSLSPINVSTNSIPAGGPGLSLLVDAPPVMFDDNAKSTSNANVFSLHSIVAWNGERRPTAFISSTRLRVDISAADIETPGTARISVFDLSPGGGTSPSVNFTIASNPLAAVVCAASYLPQLAPESIAAAFGSGLAPTTQVAATNPLPTTLAGTTLRVKDSAGIERLAPLLFVSPGQINFQMPPGTAIGDALLTSTKGDGTASSRLMRIAIVAPGLFSANANAEGVAAAQALRVKADGSQSYEPVAQFDQAQNKFIALPIDLGPATDQVFLVAFGTGIRLRSSLSAVTATIGGVGSSVPYAGAQGVFVGLDQLNVVIPRSLAGRGDVDFNVTAEGKTANTVRVNIK